MGDAVSIRFKVRGGFRHIVVATYTLTVAIRFQSALRFAVVSDFILEGIDAALEEQAFQSALRFAVASDPYPLARRPDKPCCGVLTHHSFSPPPTRGQLLSSMG